MNSAIKGILICLIGYFFVSLTGLFEKAISHGITLPVILFFQNTVCFVCIFIEWQSRGRVSLKTKNVASYMIRIASGLACFAVLFYIIRFIPISEALVFQYSASMWIPFIMLFWLKVPMPKNIWGGILIGFIGIVLILNPSLAMLNKIAFFGILCGVLQAISIVAIRKLAMIEPIWRVLFYYFLAGSIILAPLAIEHWPALDAKDFLLLVGVGLTTFVGQKLVAISLKYATPTTLAPICYSTILYSGLFAWMFWKESVSIEELVGMALVVSGCMFTLIINRKQSDQEPEHFPSASAATRVLVAIHCYKKQESVIRIISARKATKNESAQYHGGVI